MNFYAHVYTTSFDVREARAALVAVEEALGILPLIHRIDASGFHELQDPARWLAEHARGGAPVLGNVPDDNEFVGFSASWGYGDPYCAIFVQMPCTSRFLDSAPRLMQMLPPAASASRAYCSPPAPLAVIMARAGREKPPFSPVRPSGIEWLNYWSGLACSELGVSSADPRKALFARVSNVADGLFLQLTEEPLDLLRPEHQEALRRATTAFFAT